MPVLEGHAGAASLSQGARHAHAGVAAPARCSWDSTRSKKAENCAAERAGARCPRASAAPGAGAAASATSPTRSGRRSTAVLLASPAPASARSRSMFQRSAQSSSNSIMAVICVPSDDYVVGAIEHLVPLMARVPGLSNALAGRGSGQAVLKAIGLVHTPRLSGVDIERELERRGVAIANPDALRGLPEAARGRSVVVVQDAFTSYYETTLLLDLLELHEVDRLAAVAGPVSAQTARRFTCTGSSVPSSASLRRTRRCSRSSRLPASNSSVWTPR